MNKLVSFFKDESGATAIEYGLIAALIAVAAIGAMTRTGGEIQELFAKIANNINKATPKN